MSAFMVVEQHINAMVHVALKGPSDYGKPWYSVGVEPESADGIGRMLWHENAASIEARYGPDAGQFDLAATYRYTTPVGRIPSAVEALKLISCYEYQSCEHPGWTGSRAHAFCQSLTGVLIGCLPGYDAAPWEWTS